MFQGNKTFSVEKAKILDRISDINFLTFFNPQKIIVKKKVYFKAKDIEESINKNFREQTKYKLVQDDGVYLRANKFTASILRKSDKAIEETWRKYVKELDKLE